MDQRPFWTADDFQLVTRQILARLIVFNRRRAGDVEKILFADFHKWIQNPQNDDGLAIELNEEEKELERRCISLIQYFINVKR